MPDLTNDHLPLSLSLASCFMTFFLILSSIISILYSLFSLYPNERILFKEANIYCTLYTLIIQYWRQAMNKNHLFSS